MEQEQLIKTVVAAQNGDNDALSQLFDSYYNDLYYFALKTVKDSELASDITQEAFIDIINGINSLKEPAAFVSWAKKVTYFQCTRYFKKKKDVIVDEDEDGNSVFDTLKEENSEFIPDEALERDDFKRMIMSIIDELSEEQRAAVMMYYFDELSVSQIAEIQGVSEGTIKSRLNYARKAIKQSVENYEKKNNIKLHAFPFFPFIRFLFAGEKGNTEIPQTDFKRVTQMLAKGGVKATTKSVVKSTAKAGVKAAVTKIAAVAAAATVVAGGAVGGIALKNHFDKGEPSSQSQNAQIQEIEPYDSFVDLRDETAEFIDKSKPYEEIEKTILNDGGLNYKMPIELYNVFGYNKKYIEKGSRLFIEYDRNGDEKGFVIQYKIPCKDQKTAEKMIRNDIMKAHKIMQEVYNGNSISPDYLPDATDNDYRDVSYGAYMLMLSYNELVPAWIGSYIRNSVDFKFACKEIDGEFYYCPKIVMKTTDHEGDGEWNVSCRTGLILMEY